VFLAAVIPVAGGFPWQDLPRGEQRQSTSLSSLIATATNPAPSGESFLFEESESRPLFLHK